MAHSSASAPRTKARRVAPTYYARAYAYAALTLDQLAADLGHRISSPQEYVDDHAKLILSEQVGAGKADRYQVMIDAGQELAETWANRLAPNFKLDLFKKIDDRDEFFGHLPKGDDPDRFDLEVVIDFSLTSDQIYPEDQRPTRENDTTASALAQITKDISKRGGLYERLEEFDALNPMKAEIVVYLNGNDLTEQITDAVVAKSLPKTRSRYLDI